MKKSWSIVLFVLMVLSLCTIGVVGQNTEAPAKIRVGTQPWIGYGPWWIAQEQGIFEKNGLEVELIDFIEDKEVNAAFASGNMEAANIATHTALKLYSVGLDLKLVLLQDVSTTADAILAGPEITAISDLSGKSVAFEEGTTSDLLLNYALSQAGLTIADINPVPMPASDAGAALLAGSVPASVTYEPYISEVLKNNSSLSILYAANERPGLISDVLVVNTKWAEENPETLSKLLRCWDEALAFYYENPQEGQAIIAKAVGAAPEDLVSAFEGVQFYSGEENKTALADSFLATIQDVAEVSKNIGLFDTIPDLSELVEAGYFE